METLIKSLVGGCFTIFCLIFGLFPEGCMWFLWHLVAPSNGTERFMMAALFLLWGGGLSLFTGIVASIFWLSGIAAILDS